VSAIRVILIALGCLFAMAACFVGVGIVVALYKERDSLTGGEVLQSLLFEAMFALPAVGFFYLARLAERRQEAIERESRLLNPPVEIFCPECDSDQVVQGPEKRSLSARRTYVARCLACGHRLSVSFQDWRWLPLPEGGDAFETSDDRNHLMRRTPMTTGQAVFVFVGLVGTFVVLFLVVDDVDGAFTGNGVLFPVFSGFVLYGLWRTGRFLFPPKPTVDRVCSTCGRDSRSRGTGVCPECGATSGDSA